MAKEIAKLLRTEMAADVTALPMLAKLLQAYGRKGDKVLAHITPEEAQRLEDEGGSGTINPHTGLPEYFDGEDYFGYTPPAQTEAQTYGAGDAGGGFPAETAPVQAPVSAETTPYMNADYSLPSVGSPLGLSTADAGVGFRATPEQAFAFTPPALQGVGTIPAQEIKAAETTLPPPEEKGILDKLGLTKEQALRLGLGGVSALATGLAGQRAVKQAKQAREDVAALGRPYQETGKQLQAAAMRGELTPAGQQQLQAAQAQLAQGIERRGGVGAQQAATQVAAFRQNLLDQQYNYGLKVAQIGDAYAAQAIRTGLTQDQEMVRLMSNLAGTLGSVYGGMPNVAGTTTARA